MSSSYFSSICSLFERKSKLSRLENKNDRPKSITTRSSCSSTAVVKCGYDELYYNTDENDTMEDPNDISSNENDSNYCIIDNFRSLPFKKLALMYNLPELFSGNDQDIISEFTFLQTQIKQICHQLDSCRGAVQFAETDVTIGQKLKDIILFIRSRYHEDENVGDSGIAFLALLLLSIQVLQTVPEVKEQLLHRTHIGRCIILNMLYVLKNPKNEINTPRLLYDQIDFMQILFDCKHLKEMPDMIDILTEISEKFAKIDKDWFLIENYTRVVTLARDLFSY